MADKKWQLELERLFWEFENEYEPQYPDSIRRLEARVGGLIERTLEKATTCPICGDSLGVLCPDCTAGDIQADLDYLDEIRERRPL